MADTAETLFPIDDDDARATGLMPAQYLKALIERREVRAIDPLLADQLQPASIDLRLGANAWRVRASFLPGRGGSVQDKIGALAMHRFELTDEGAVLERG